MIQSGLDCRTFANMLALCKSGWRRVRKSTLLILILVTTLVVYHLSNNGAPNTYLVRKEIYSKYQASEPTRTGPGEQGKPFALDEQLQAKYKQQNKKEGFNFGVSEVVALDRTLKDMRTTK